MIKKIAFGSLISLIFSSCASIYMPTTLPVFDFTEQGDVVVAATVSTSGTNGMAGVALRDDIHLATDFTFSKVDDTNNNSKRSSGNLMLGKTWNVYEDIKYKSTLGYGLGQGQSSIMGDGVILANKEASGKYQTFIWLHNLEYNHQYFTLAGHLKTQYLNFYELNLVYNTNPAQIQRSDAFLIEPGLTVMVGGDHLKVFLQGSLTGDYFWRPQFDYRIFQFSMGAYLRLGTSRSDKKLTH